MLWDLFLHVGTADAGKLNTELMEACLSLDGVGLGYLTTGMFWVNPQQFLPFSKFGVFLGVESNVQTSKEYRSWLHEVLAKKSEEESAIKFFDRVSGLYHFYLECDRIYRMSPSKLRIATNR